MNKELIDFIDLCIVDGITSDKEREVIFRKSKELGVPEDECEIILDGMIFKYNKENETSPSNPEPNLIEQKLDEKINITPLKEEEVDSDFLKILFYSKRDELIKSIENRIIFLNERGQELLEERNKCDVQFKELFNRKRNINRDSNEVELIDKELYSNDQILIQIKNDINSTLEESQQQEVEKERLLEHYTQEKYELFVFVYKKTPILYQSVILGKYLQETKLSNDEQILNLTRFNKFLSKKERKYSRSLEDCFKKVESGDISQKDVELIINERKSLISFYNSFHFMFNSLLANKMGVYLRIYSDLESMGIFNSYYEKEVLRNFHQVNRHLNQLNSTLSQVTKELSQTNNYLRLLNDHMYNVHLSLDQIDYSLSDISYSITQGNESLESSLDLLEDLNKGMGLNNLLTGIQTYQTYKINKSLLS